jgi:prepilin-type N-terminal cleavage/methylation domain-containing protein
MLAYIKDHLKNRFTGNCRGFTMIEVAIAMVVLGFIVASIAPVMALNVKNQVKYEEERIADNLTRAQFEYIKSQEYNWGNESWPVTYDTVIPDIKYGIDIDITPIDPNTRLPLYAFEDMGVQEITVTVFGYGLGSEDPLKFLLQTTGYKVHRSVQITGYEITG